MTLAADLRDLADQWLPRILTQMDRDPRSSTYGCADRNWWHYKIRDFPSIILQQAGYTMWLASQQAAWRKHRIGLNSLAVASARFWSVQVSSRRTFDEYYPWEQGYPPLAFSTLAALKLADEGAVDSDDIRAGAVYAARLLVRRFEDRALNQQMAGCAALLFMHKVFPDLMDRDVAIRVVDKALAMQTQEGWFPEYGGPDLGYLSVTLDCLWDAYDSSGYPPLRKAIQKAVVYIDAMTAWTGASIGMHNARNTDYIVPYGIVRCATEDGAEDQEVAGRLMQRLYGTLASPEHFLRSLDDRYLCHYIGHSLLRSLPLLREWAPHDSPSPQTVPDVSACRVHYYESGHVVCPEYLLSLKKGGILTIKTAAGDLRSDYGWSFRWRKIDYVSHWWSYQWRHEPLADGWLISGDMVPCREIISTPFRHILLRIASRCTGPMLIAYLKRLLIFRTHTSPFLFTRRIRKHKDRIVIEDRIEGLPPDVDPVPAPRASKRHVASADSYHEEDLLLQAPAQELQRTIQRNGTAWEARTIYSLE